MMQDVFQFSQFPPPSHYPVPFLPFSLLPNPSDKYMYKYKYFNINSPLFF